ncbi:MAG: phosphoribosylformylglycinamidine cyclo-ligase [Clostridia bacterium]|nr:phosphoribosylformylglycinamidine cyclo-ligase [Clostridia bacterium]
MKSYSDAYKEAGVDITAGYKAIELMKEHVQRTFNDMVLSGGGFGGAIELDITGIKRPVLVSGTDGVGTKLKLAFEMNKHDSIGIDCVAMCVNDVICRGARPVLFLDYIATGKTDPKRIAEIVSGVAEGCVQAGAALIGGETAEMPGFYPDDEYDIAGFTVGLIDRDRLLDRRNVKAGDVLIALPSSGVHSNGFSLVRKILKDSGTQLDLYVPELGRTVGDELLTPTRIYAKQVRILMDNEIKVNSISHITGGAYYEKLPRSLADGIGARIDRNAIKVLPVFDWLQKTGNISERDMFNVFNMGIGMIFVVDKNDADRCMELLSAEGDAPYIIGETVVSDEGTVIC